MIVTNEVHIPVWGTYVTTPVINADFARVNIKTKVEHSTTFKGALRLVTAIKYATGTIMTR